MPEFIKENVLLAPFCGFKCGGACRYYLDAGSCGVDVLERALDFAAKKSLPVKILSGGYNTLVADNPSDFLLIHFKPCISEPQFLDGYTTVLASMPLPSLLAFWAKNNVGNVDFLAGIPGSIGGAICMNAGISQPERLEISSLFVSAIAIDLKTQKVVQLGKSDMFFNYRSSVLQQGNYALLSAKFYTPNIDLNISEKIRQAIEQRKLRQPKNNKNVGSVFKNVNGVSAGYYIDKCNLKGFSVGGAIVSNVHANWVLNENNATSADILRLTEHIQKCVYEKFKIKLELEMRILK